MMSNQTPRAQPDVLADAALDADIQAQDGAFHRPDAEAAQHDEMRRILARLAHLYDVLGEIASALGTTPEALARDETLERIETAPAILSVAALAAWQPSDMVTWFATFGDDLTLSFAVVGLDAPTRSQTAHSAGDAADVLAAVVAQARAAADAEGDSVQVEVRLRVGKTRVEADARALLTLRATLAGTTALLTQTRCVVCYCSATWQRLLTPRALLQWEALGLVREGWRTVVMLCDTPGYLAGMALEVIGAVQERGSAGPRWFDVSRSTWLRFVERARETRRLAAEESLWATAPQVLTAQHLRLEQRAPGLTQIARAGAAARAMLAAADLANSVRDADDDHTPCLVLRFAGARPQSCTLALTAGSAAQSTLPASADDPYAGAALGRLAAWAYEHTSADKLEIAREALARELPNGASLRLEDVEQAAVGALDAAKANFVLYLRQSSAQYFQLRQQGLDAVAQYAAGVRRAVGDLTSDVVDNVYRTVGLLVGVVVAALLQPTLALAVQRLAAALYVLYIAFIVLFLLRARHQRVDLEYADLEQRLASMPELSGSERARLRGQPHAERDYFERYYRLSWWLYLALGACGVVYLVLLCSPLAGHLPLVTPVTAPTAVPTPHP